MAKQTVRVTTKIEGANGTKRVRTVVPNTPDAILKAQRVTNLHTAARGDNVTHKVS